MNIVKRIFLYLITNILIIATLSLIVNALGLHGYLNQHGIDYQALAALCLIWGMTSSVIALWLSRWTAKTFMNVQLIDPSHASSKEKELVHTIHRLARRLGISVMPQVGIYQANEVNAFATGPTKNRALVAVSSGLLTQMNSDEVEGVLAHEVSHINNGDMVTMTLLQGVVNAFSLFLSRIVAYALSMAWANRKEREQQYPPRFLYSILTLVFDILFTLLGSLVLAAFSRYREYRADKGGARLVGRHKMIAALERLGSLTVPTRNQDETSALSNLKINSKTRTATFLSLLATHPDIDLRIAALQMTRGA